MSQAPTSSGLVRVTITSRSRRVDLALPGAVPVAELVPELARSVGLLDPATLHGGYHLVASDGRRLAPGAGLSAQGVEDGGVLSVAAGVDEEPPRVYDDVVEAMGDLIEGELPPWEPGAARRTALVASSLLMVLGAAALLAQRGAALAATAAVVVTAGLVTGAVVLSRARGETEAAVVVAWMGCLYAAVAGLLLAPVGAADDTVARLVDAAPLAGAGASLVGLVCLVGLGEGRTFVLPPVVAGTVLGAAGPARAVGLDPRVVLVVALVLGVLASSAGAWLALGVTGTTVDRLHEPADLTADVAAGAPGVDSGALLGDARLAHQILVSLTATVGLLLVLVAPPAVDLGVAGTALAVVACLVVMLRTRQHRAGAEVLVGLVSGVLGLGTVAVSSLLLHPPWRPAAAVVLAGAGAVLLAATLLPGGSSVRRGRWGDLAEGVALVAMLPLLVLASGVLAATGGG